jgi:hypothetical protein
MAWWSKEVRTADPIVNGVGAGQSNRYAHPMPRTVEVVVKTTTAAIKDGGVSAQR